MLAVDLGHWATHTPFGKSNSEGRKINSSGNPISELIKLPMPIPSTFHAQVEISDENKGVDIRHDTR